MNMEETIFQKEEQQYTKLPHFGIPKLLPYLKPLRKVIWSMIALCLLGGFIDTVMPLFQ